MEKIIFGLGSNIGNAEHNFASAISLLKKRLIYKVTRSVIYKSPPLLPKNAPKSWNKEFSNMAVSGILKSQLVPEEILAVIKEIEVQIGREASEKWAPRKIDIDILAWGNLIYESEKLNIPHKELLNRDFALKPLLEIAPNWKHPKQ